MLRVKATLPVKHANLRLCAIGFRSCQAGTQRLRMKFTRAIFPTNKRGSAVSIIGNGASAMKRRTEAIVFATRCEFAVGIIGRAAATVAGCACAVPRATCVTGFKAGTIIPCATIRIGHGLARSADVRALRKEFALKCIPAVRRRAAHSDPRDQDRHRALDLASSSPPPFHSATQPGTARLLAIAA